MIIIGLPGQFQLGSNWVPTGFQSVPAEFQPGSSRVPAEFQPNRLAAVFALYVRGIRGTVPVIFILPFIYY
jgi:hypothetical protein